jgi:chorismate dehydratase
MAEPVRVGAVSYLNTRPLVYQLEQFAPHADVVYDLPSRLSAQLAAGQLDVALIPSIEYILRPGYAIVSDACIGCRGPVLSVKLFCRVALQRIRTLALDEGSRTSVALVQILLRERFGIRPRLEALPIGAGLPDTRADAVLLIGDRAIQADQEPFADVWDLGDEWCRWADLPFVFALWAARADTDLRGVDQALGAARDAGVRHLVEIAQAEAPHVGLDFDSCLTYLRDNLYFYFGPSEQRGLALFYRHAARLGLAPATFHLRRYDRSPPFIVSRRR